MIHELVRYGKTLDSRNTVLYNHHHDANRQACARNLDNFAYISVSDDFQMELRPQYVFHQPVNDATGYSIVLLDEIAELEIITDNDDLNPIKKFENSSRDEATPVEIIVKGNVISLDQAESIWENRAPALYLVENPLTGRVEYTNALREYQPLEHFTGLFRAFAETPISPTGILEFVQKFGLLADRDEHELDLGYVIVPELYGPNEAVHAESLYDWVEQILAMREAVTLWDMARARDEKGLSRYVRWKDGALSHWTDHHGWNSEFSLIYEIDIEAVQALRFREGDVIEPAIFMASLFANSELEGRASPQFRLIEDNTLRLVTNPLDLLGALWLQLARAIDGNKEYRACENCQTWFEIGLTGYSRARRFCSNRCRVAFNRKQKRAQEKKQ